MGAPVPATWNLIAPLYVTSTVQDDYPPPPPLQSRGRKADGNDCQKGGKFGEARPRPREPLCHIRSSLPPDVGVTTSDPVPEVGTNPFLCRNSVGRGKQGYPTNYFLVVEAEGPVIPLPGSSLQQTGLDSGAKHPPEGRRGAEKAGES